MNLFSSFMRPLALSKIGDLFSSGFNRVDPPSVPSGSTKTIEPTKMGDAPSAKPVTDKTGFDQEFINSQAKGFDTPGQISGTRAPGDTPGSTFGDSPDLAQYKAQQQKKWQAEQDAKARDKLFGQATPGRVDGKEVEPFSSRALEKNADDLVKADAAQKKRGLVLPRKDILKTAAITAAVTAPLTTVGALVSGTVLEALKPFINTPETPATVQSVDDGRVVDHLQKNVFVLANTLSDLRSQAHVEPGLKWAMQTNDERMDSLEEMLDYIEPALAQEAQQRDVSFQPASTGIPQDDIKSRAVVLESRMAALTALMGAMTAKIPNVAA